MRYSTKSMLLFYFRFYQQIDWLHPLQMEISHPGEKRETTKTVNRVIFQHDNFFLSRGTFLARVMCFKLADVNNVNEINMTE